MSEKRPGRRRVQIVLAMLGLLVVVIGVSDPVSHLTRREPSVKERAPETLTVTAAPVRTTVSGSSARSLAVQAAVALAVLACVATPFVLAARRRSRAGGGATGAET